MSFEQTKTLDAAFVDKWTDDNICFLNYKIFEVVMIDGVPTEGTILSNISFQAPIAGGALQDSLGREAYAALPKTLVDAYAAYQTEFDAFATQILTDNKCAP